MLLANGSSDGSKDVNNIKTESKQSKRDSVIVGKETGCMIGKNMMELITPPPL